METFMSWTTVFLILMLVNLAGWWLALRQNSRLRKIIAIQADMVSDTLELAKRTLEDRNRIMEQSKDQRAA
jgi:TM2 domain-containing membrane protein YozV